MNEKVAVVTIAHGRHGHLHRQHVSLARGQRLPDHYIVVAMQDADIVPSTVGSVTSEVVGVVADPSRLPLARARNVGVERALEYGADVIVLLDVDCLAGRGFVEGYRARISAASEVIWSGPVSYLAPPGPRGYDIDALADVDDPHPARPAPAEGEWSRGADPALFWSLSFALHADAWRETGGFCELYEGYGGEDTDFAQVARGKGLDLGWTGDARAYHQHHPVRRPPVEHVADIVKNATIYYERWGQWPMEGWLAAFAERGLVRFDAGRWQLEPMENKS